VVLDVGGADQRVVFLVGNREDDPLVGVLEDVRVVVLEQAPHHDVAALDQPQRAAGASVDLVGQELRRPRAGRVDQRTGAQRAGPAAGVREHHLPAGRGPARAGAGPARQHLRAVLGRVDRVEHDEPRVVDPAVGVHEALAEGLLQRQARRVHAQVDGARRGQHLAAGEVVVQEQARPDHPHRTHARVVRHHEAQWPHDVRRAAQQHLAFGERLAHQRELAVLEVAKAAMDELGRRRRGVGRQVIALAQHHRQAPSGEVAGDAGPVDTPTDHQHVAGVGGFGRREGGR
jgi:hypothetical protein